MSNIIKRDGEKKKEIVQVLWTLIVSVPLSSKKIVNEGI